MFGKIKWLRLTPDRPGRGGWKTGIHSFQQEPVNDVRILQGGHVYQGAWRRDYDPVTYPNPQVLDGLGFPIALTVHGYVYPSLTDPSAQPNVTIMSQHAGAGLTTTRIWDFTGSLRQARPYTNQLGVWQNINGRCFFADGATEALVMDDRTPAIHAQKNQTLGIGTPTQALQKSAGDGISPYGTGYCYNGSNYITHPNPDNMLSTIITTDNVAISPPNVSYGQYGGVAIVAASPSSNGVTSNTTPFTAAGGLTIDPAVNPSLVTLTGGATWPAAFAYCGLAVNFGGVSYVILGTGDGASTIYDINGNGAVLANNQAYILGVYDGPALTAVPYTITGSRVLMPGAASSLTMLATGTLGYSQTTRSNLVQVQLLVVRAGGLFRNLGNISLGPPSGGTRQTVTDAVMTTLTNDIRSATKPWTTNDVGSTMVIDNATLVGAGDMLISPITAFINSGSVHVADNNAGATVTNVRAWWGPGIISVTDGAMNVGTLDHLHSASNPFVVGDVGKTIMVAGAGNVAGTIALFTTIASFVSISEVVLTAPCLVAAGVTGKKAAWGAGTANTTAGPSYAYAWYDPETGHCSNISPLFQIPKPTIQGNYPDFANITPYFTVDRGYISYPNATDATRFSHILFFRTLSGGNASTLYPIGSLNPFVGKVHPGSASTRGSWNPNTYHGWMGLPNNYCDAPPSVPANVNVWYDFSSDSDLLLSGGFRAPQFTNEKPKVLLRGGATQTGYPYAMAYWDRRLWIANTQAPGEILFSCDEAQCPLGVPEESFPPTNLLPLPSVDGRVIGMRTVGDMLLVTTERWAYVVAGNNESNYRLLKVSASMPGVGTYQMDEFPTYTGAQGEPATLFYLGRDRKVYQWTFGSNVQTISQPIQDQLDALLQAGTPLTTYQGSFVHCVSAWGRRLVVVAPYMQVAAGNNGYPTFIYDIDNQVWSQSTRNDTSVGNAFSYNAPMATVYGLNIPVNEIYSIVEPSNFGKVGVFSWLRDDSLTCTFPLNITTFPMNFDGKKVRKRIAGVNIHATAGTYTLSASVNETPAFSIVMGLYPDRLYSVYGSGATPVDGNLEDLVILSGQLSASTNPLIGYRFSFNVQRTDNLPAKVYAMDVAYQEDEEAGEGDP